MDCLSWLSLQSTEARPGATGGAPGRHRDGPAATRPPPRRATSVELAGDDLGQLLEGVLEAIVDHDVGELGLGGELLLGDP